MGCKWTAIKKQQGKGHEEITTAFRTSLLLAYIDISEFSELTLLQDWITETLQTLSVRIDLTSNDCREFVELCMVFIGYKGFITFKSPTAIHKAR